jgi:hypothetical protein
MLKIDFFDTFREELIGFCGNVDLEKCAEFKALEDEYAHLWDRLKVILPDGNPELLEKLNENRLEILELSFELFYLEGVKRCLLIIAEGIGK